MTKICFRSMTDLFCNLIRSAYHNLTDEVKYIDLMMHYSLVDQMMPSPKLGYKYSMCSCLVTLVPLCHMLGIIVLEINIEPSVNY